MLDPSIEETYSDVTSRYMYWDRSSILSTYHIRRALYKGDIGSATFMSQHTPFPIGNTSIVGIDIDSMKRNMEIVDILEIDRYDPLVIENTYQWWSIHDQRLIDKMIVDPTISTDRRLALAYATRSHLSL